jgi:glycosyltransferase involved in cell wall biosynthesis
MLVRDLVRRKNRWLKTAWIRLIERRNLERAAGIHVTAPLEHAELEKFGFSLPPVHYVPNGIDVPDMAALAGSPSAVVPRQPYVLFLSRINWKKGLDRLVRAWARVPDWLLVVAGNDEENYRAEIEQLAYTQGVADRIRFVGPVRGRDKWLLYRQASLFVLPSYSENFGMVVLEAMAMGCPVVVTPDVGLAAAVAESGCGRVVEGEPAALAAVVNAMLGDPEQRRSMGARGSAAVNGQFLWQDVARQMERVYASISQPKP